jgi:hypothetical protein
MLFACDVEGGRRRIVELCGALYQELVYTDNNGKADKLKNAVPGCC